MTNSQSIIDAAKDAGIKLDFINVELYTTYMGADIIEEGRRAARWLLENTYMDETYKIVETQGTEGSQVKK